MKQLPLFILTLLAFSACHEPDGAELERLVIKEGRHRATPYSLTWSKVDVLSYTWIFDESAAYELGSNDQCDWNKLTGASFHLFTNHKNSVMASWRWDRDGFLWIAPYYHKDGMTRWASALCTSVANVDRSLEAITLGVGETLSTQLRIDRQRNETTLIIENVTTGERTELIQHWDKIKRVREIYPWFGGNEKSPQDIFILREKIKA